MFLVEIKPEDVKVGMTVFIDGHRDIAFGKPCLVKKLYDRPQDVGFDVIYDGTLFTISDYSLTCKECRLLVYSTAKQDANGRNTNEWSDQHYSFEYPIQQADKESGSIRVDPYFVSKQWQLGKKDDTGTIFHILKTIARFGDKNSKEREIKALYAQVKRLAELEGVDLN